MKALIDLHCHSIASGHAYSTIEENIAQARNKGLKIVGVADHAPSMQGGPNIFYFYNLQAIPREVHGLTLLKGVEANIMDFQGNIDMPVEVLEKLDYAIASLHPPCIDPGTMEENTAAILGAIHNPYVKIIGHPDDSRYPLDYEVIVKAAKEHNVALEINNSSLMPYSFRSGAHENVKIILNLCEKYGTHVILSSDAHFSTAVGDFSNCMDIIDEVHFPKALIINFNEALINQLMGKELL